MATSLSPASPVTVSAAVAPQISPPPPLAPPASLSSPPSLPSVSPSSSPPSSLSPPPQPPISQPNATPDLSAPPPATATATASSPPPLPSPSPPLPSPPPLTLSPPPTLSFSPPPPPLPLPTPPPPILPPPAPVVTSSPPPPAAAPPPVSSPPVTSSPPLITLSPPPPSISPPTPSLSPPATKTKPPPSPPLTELTPPPKTPTFSPPKSKSPTPPSLSSPPPVSSPSLPSPPLPSPTPNSSITTKDSSPPVSSFPLATPTTQTDSPPITTQNTTTDPRDNPSSNKSMNSGIGQNSSSGGSGLSTGAVASIAVVIGFLVISLVGLALWYVKKKRRPIDGYNSVYVMPSPLMSSPKSGESPMSRPASTPFAHNSTYSSGTSQNLVNSHYFTYEDLYNITEGFSANKILGEGGFGCVYKGVLPDGREVAVKRLTGGGDQGEREFKAEVEIISRVHHRHLVSLVGYCMEREQRLLVYDFVPNNTLHFHLHGQGRLGLEWSVRVKIAAGAARGIAYLHEDCHPRIIHRDIKSSNILLDDSFEAQVADFGLARLAMDAVTHVTTRVMGTFGYLAPEYASSGKLTERSDVFSFGVVLLELITGRRPVDASRPLGDESLVEWARPLLTQALETGNLRELVDPRLENKYNEVEMIRMIEAAAACVRHSASRRPRMSQVATVLDSLADVDLTNGIQPGKSELFNVANSAEIRIFQRMAFGSHEYSSSEFEHSSSLNSRRDYQNLL